MVLVGTKSDMQREVPDTYGDQKRSNINLEAETEKCLTFAETSAHEDVESVLMLLDEIITLIKEKRLYAGSSGPVSTMNRT